MTAARTAEDMTICRPCAAKQIRSAAWTERPTPPVSVSAGRPRCMPIRSRTSTPSGQAPACIARWIASTAWSAAGVRLEHREDVVPTGGRLSTTGRPHRRAHHGGHRRAGE
jgi:hypothetical protein